VLIAVQVATRIRAIASSSEGVEREEAPLLELELAVVGLETFWNWYTYIKQRSRESEYSSAQDC